MESNELTVRLVMTPDMASSLQQDTTALEVAQAYVIDSHEMAEAANEELKAVKARIKAVDEWKTKFVQPAKDIIASAEALFNPALASLGNAERHLKGAISNWMAEQQRIADEARQKAEAEERERRQKAEREAAAARARAEQEAAEARRKAAEAEAARRKAEAEGNAAAARRAAEAAAKAQADAAAAIETGEARANTAVLEAAAVTPAVVHAPQKLSGFSSRDNWVAVGEVAEAEAIKLIAQALPERPELIAYLKLDMSAINKTAKAMKSHTNIPGFRAENKPIAASRAA